MGYQYELNVKVEITPNVYKESLAYIVKNYTEEEEYFNHASEKKQDQFVSFSSDYGFVYFQRYNVITKEGTFEKYFISQNTAPMGNGESTNLTSLQDDIVEAKENIEDFLNGIGFGESFKLSELELGYACQEAPYMEV